MTKSLPVVERLWKNTIIEKGTNCWRAQGFHTKDGYVRVYYHGINVFVHRLSAHLFHGLGLTTKQDSRQANHIRECPNPDCWNPEHIYVGTQSENRIDSFMLNKSVMFGGHRTKK